jgi:iron complex transport system permease protein
VKRTLAWFAALSAVLAVSMILAALVGDGHLTFARIVSALRAGVGSELPDAVIVWQIRLPRILLAALVGASLAASGTAFQSLLRNTLADPFLVGVSAGASVGAEAVLLRHQETTMWGVAVPGAAFAAAAAAMSLVYAIARRGGRILVTSLLLGGVVVSAFLGSVSVLLLTLAHPNDLQRIQYRLNGSLADATYGQCFITLVFFVLGFMLLLLQARAMNLYALGEEAAQQLGLEAERFKTSLILTGSLLAAVTVAVAGIIGFVGLMVPHIARRLSGTPDHRQVLPLAALAGAVLMVWADTAARTALPDGRELPVGLVTAFLGAPFFLSLLRRQTRHGA